MTNIIIKNKANESFKAGDIAIFAPNDEKFTANYLIIGKPYRIDEINERGLLKILDEAGGYGFYSANHFKPLSVVQNEIAKLLGHKLSFTAYSGIGFVHGKELIADSIKEKITEAMQQNPKSQSPTKKLALVKKVSLSHEGKILMLNAFVDYEEGGSQNACGFVLDTYSKELGERYGSKNTTIERIYDFSEFARIPKTMPFGKHKGAKMEELPKDYIDWALKNLTDIDQYLKKALEKARGANV